MSSMVIKKDFSQQLVDYLSKEFFDKAHGGLYASINQTNADVITEDKLLLDVSLALIAYQKQNKEEKVKELLEQLNLFNDPIHMGYYEILDSVSFPHDVGKVKTIFTQLLTGYAIYIVGKYLKDEKLYLKGKKLVTYIADRYFNNNHPHRMTNDWGTVLDSNKQVKDISLILLVLNEIEATLIHEFDAFSLLKNFIDGEKGIYSVLDIQNQPIAIQGKSLEDMSIFMYCLATVDKDNQYYLIIRNTITFILNRFRHPLTGGFWNISNSDGEVLVDSIPTYYNHQRSPFPMKSMVDHVLFLLAVKQVVNKMEKNDFHDLRKELVDEISKFWDRKNGGISLGQGYWFGSPTKPTVPLARLIMVPPHTVGSFAVGNTYYLPLHQKTASLQLLGIMALEGEEISPVIKLKNINYEKKKVYNDLSYISKGVLTSSYINAELYVKWLDKTKSGFGFGLTANRSPLGFRSDKTPQNFSAMHVLSDYLVLKQKIKNKESLLTTLYASQNKDGGFGEQPSLLSELFTTYCVVVSAYILNDDNYNKEKCIEFIKSCQNEDGGFGNAPGYPSDIWHSNFGTLTLHLLGAEPIDREKLIQYHLNSQNKDGGFGITPGKKSEVYSTFRAISNLTVLGVDIPYKENTIRWLKELQDPNGGFHYQEENPVTFVGSYHAIAALYLLGELPSDVETCKKWIAQHQSPDGGFSRVINTPSDTTDEGFISIQASYMLERKLNPYWVAIIT